MSFKNPIHSDPILCLGDEIVVRIDDEKCSDLFNKRQICHVFFPICRRVSPDTQASSTDAVNVAVFFLTNSCTVSAPLPVQEFVRKNAATFTASVQEA